jgi:ABC-type Zn2+ transport system substrate-binding protein/surface adhesin
VLSMLRMKKQRNKRNERQSNDKHRHESHDKHSDRCRVEHSHVLWLNYQQSLEHNRRVHVDKSMHCFTCNSSVKIFAVQCIVHFLGIDIELIDSVRWIIVKFMKWLIHRIIGRFKAIRLIAGLENTSRIVVDMIGSIQRTNSRCQAN